MKCTACSSNNCELRHENRDKCSALEENVSCRCRCAISEKQYWATHASYVGAGVAAAAVGTSLTVMSGGILTAVVAPLLFHSAWPLITMPLITYFKNERMTAEETTKDVALGASVGAITGPIGSGGSALANSTSGVTKFGIRMLTSSTEGAVSNGVIKGARVLKGEAITMPEVYDCMKKGAVIGVVGGASGELVNGVSNQLSSGFARVLARIGFTGVSTAATDASIQLYETGTVDRQQVLLNTAGQVAVAASAEASAAVSQRTAAYNSKVNERLMQKNNVDPETRREIREAISEANSLKEGAIAKGRYAGERNIHNLKRDRNGQIAADISPKADNGKRGAGRVILQEVNGRKVYVDHSDTHNYKECRRALPNEINNPLDASLVQRKVHTNLTDGECNNDGESMVNEKPPARGKYTWKWSAYLIPQSAYRLLRAAQEQIVIPSINTAIFTKYFKKVDDER